MIVSGLVGAAPGPVEEFAPRTSKAKFWVRPSNVPPPSKPSDKLGPLAKLAKAETATR